MDIEVIAAGVEQSDLRVGKRSRRRGPNPASSRRLRQWKFNGSGDSGRTAVNVRSCADDASGRDVCRENSGCRIESHRSPAGSSTRVGRSLLRAGQGGLEYENRGVVAPATRR
jgi:hypothetical protein